MKLTRQQATTAVLIIALIFLNIIFHFFIRKEIMVNIRRRVCYAMLSTAYYLEGRKGIDRECARLAAQEIKYPGMTEVIDSARRDLKKSQDPKGFLQDSISKSDARIGELERQRLIVVTLILLALLARLILFVAWKDKH